MNSDRLRQLILLEDSEPDVLLIRRELSKRLPSYELHIARTKAEFEQFVKEIQVDAILSDYRLPQYSGIEALMFARKHAPLVPFIFVTGALNNEELAADTILKGASGFVLKNNLSKLGLILPPLFTDAPSGTRRRTEHIEPASTRSHSDELARKLARADPALRAQIEALLGG